MTNNLRWSLWIAVVLVCCTLSMTACSTKEEKVASFISKGDRLLADNDPVRAILEYKNALQIDPKSACATFGLGKAYLKQHEYQRAYSAFKAALEPDAELDESRIEVAWLLAMGKQGEPALLEVAQIRHPEAFQPRLDLIKARALMATERPRDAVDLLLQAPDGAKTRRCRRCCCSPIRPSALPRRCGKRPPGGMRWTRLIPLPSCCSARMPWTVATKRRPSNKCAGCSRPPVAMPKSPCSRPSSSIAGVSAKRRRPPTIDFLLRRKP